MPRTIAGKSYGCAGLVGAESVTVESMLTSLIPIPVLDEDATCVILETEALPSHPLAPRKLSLTTVRSSAPRAVSARLPSVAETLRTPATVCLHFDGRHAARR